MVCLKGRADSLQVTVQFSIINIIYKYDRMWVAHRYSGGRPVAIVDGHRGDKAVINRALERSRYVAWRHQWSPISTHTDPLPSSLGTIRPAPVSTRNMPGALPHTPRSAAKRARQRMPLPHISGSDPSELNSRMAKSEPSLVGGSMKMTPSAPTPVWRSHTAAAADAPSAGFSDARLSISTKSLPSPWYLRKAVILVATGAAVARTLLTCARRWYARDAGRNDDAKQGCCIVQILSVAWVVSAFCMSQNTPAFLPVPVLTHRRRPASFVVTRCALGRRALGVDYGLARVGLAVSVGVAPRLLPRVDEDSAFAAAKAVAAAARDHLAEEIVLGLPLNSSGERGDQAKLTLAFAALLAEAAPHLPLLLLDERFTS
eukprot:IDg14932t1